MSRQAIPPEVHPERFEPEALHTREAHHAAEDHFIPPTKATPAFPLHIGAHQRLAVVRLLGDGTHSFNEDGIRDPGSLEGRVIHALHRLDRTHVGDPIVRAVRERLGQHDPRGTADTALESTRRQVLDEAVPGWETMFTAN